MYAALCGTKSKIVMDPVIRGVMHGAKPTRNSDVERAWNILIIAIDATSINHCMVRSVLLRSQDSCSFRAFEIIDQCRGAPITRSHVETTARLLHRTREIHAGSVD
jgi:hypothetical protein